MILEFFDFFVTLFLAWLATELLADRLRINAQSQNRNPAASFGRCNWIKQHYWRSLPNCLMEPADGSIQEMFSQMFGKRLFDLVLSILGLIVFAIPMALVAIAVRITSPGPALYWSKRVGQDNRLFAMPKFRTMQSETPVVATHLLGDPSRHLTSIGGFLRKTSLDELPQLWCILKGDMTFVGPRPALFNQEDLIEARTKKGIHALKPGLTGWAQVNGRDGLEIPMKIAYDTEYLQQRSFIFDFKILAMTIIKVAWAKDISH